MLTENNLIIIQEYLKKIYKNVKEVKESDNLLISNTSFIFDFKKEKELLNLIVDIEKEISEDQKKPLKTCEKCGYVVTEKTIRCPKCRNASFHFSY